MIDNNKKAQFPFRLRRIIYLLDTYFIPVNRISLVLDMRDMINRHSFLDSHRIRDLLLIKKCTVVADTISVEGIQHIGSYFTNFLKDFRIKRIVAALNNIHEFMDIEYPSGFRLSKDTTDYLKHIPHTAEQRKERLIKAIYQRDN